MGDAAPAGPGPGRMAVPVRNLLIGAGILFLAVYFPDSSICLGQRLLGVPCPGCGATRSVLALLGGSFLDSLAWNPGLWLGAVVFTITLINHQKSSIKWERARSAGLIAFLLVGAVRLILKVLLPSAPFLHLAF